MIDAAIVVRARGGAAQLQCEEREAPLPGAGEILVRNEAAGVNFIDVYQRTGLYPVELPFVPGNEGAGVVEVVGSGAAGFAVGDRVGYCGVIGSYARFTVVPAAKAVKLPAAISNEIAAASMLQGMTAHYLARSTFELTRGDWCVVHAAAGGVGGLLVQIAKSLGAAVIGTVSSEAKARAVKALGADEVAVHGRDDFVAIARRVTGGAGVPVVYDSIGKDTFHRSLEALAPRGMLVIYGNASGPVPPVDPLLLSQARSAYLTRPRLNDYIAERSELERRARDVFTWIKDGTLSIAIDSTFPLAEAARAHERIESRESVGKILLKM